MDHKEILLSVIVTVYNVELYVERCLESIMNQTYKKLEIIVIDDGSTDQSGKLCDKYASIDSRIRVYHKNNAGLVAARNQGVKSATGVLVTFVDGDDWLEADMYVAMMDAYVRSGADMITSGMLWEWEKRRNILLDSIMEGVYCKESIQKDILPQLMYNNDTRRQGITASVCNKLFERVLLSNIIESIDPLVTLGEDGAITYYFAAKANKIYVINKSWYHYRQHQNSMRTTHQLDSFEKLYRLKKCFINNFKSVGLELKMKYQIDAYLKCFLLESIEDIFDMNLDSISHIFPYEKISKNSKIIIYGAGKVGKSYFKCLQSGKYARVIAWVDRDYEKKRMYGLPVDSLGSVITEEYDNIIIAIENHDIAMEVKNMLLSYGIEKEKIVL